MPWLPPDSWLERCGPLAASLRAQYKLRGGEDALANALATDPRRVVALVGAPGAGTSRMALHLASSAAMAFYPDPLVAPDPAADVDQLAALVAGAADDVSPLVVLDGPSIDERLACLAELVAREVHPRLHVLVPCDHATARRLRRLAGGYPTRSILVATVQGEPAPIDVPQDFDPDAVVPLAVLGRCALDRFDGQDALIASGAAAVSGDELVCLLVDRTRAAIARARLIERADGEARLARILEAEPTRHASAFASLLRWTGEQPPLGLLDALVGFSPGQFPNPLDFWDQGIPLAPEVVDGLVRRGRALCDETSDPDALGLVRERVAIFALLRGDYEAVEADLNAALELDIDPALRARLLTHLAGVKQDAAIGARAVAHAHDAGDYRALSSALRQHASLLKSAGDTAAAIACCTEWIEVEAADGTPISLAAARSFAVGLAVDVDDHAIARSLAEQILVARRRVGDVMGQLFAHYRYAGALFATADIDGAAASLGEALALAQHIGDDTGIGYCNWLLGSIADKRGDPITADTHYNDAIDAYGAAGPVPPRLLARQRAASVAADGIRTQAAQGDGEVLPELEEGAPELPSPPSSAPALDLVQLLVRRDEPGDE